MFHGVKINDSALIAAATLSDRYITDRFLPDKAIDLVDGAVRLLNGGVGQLRAQARLHVVDVFAAQGLLCLLYTSVIR